MQEFKLNNGITIPAVGFGTYLMAPSITEKNVALALDAGYRLIDTAQNYGNEREVGAAVNNSNIKREPEVQRIAEKYNKSTAQVLLRFLNQKQIITIPKSTNAKHIQSNLDIFDFELNKEDMRNLEKLDRGQSFTGWPSSMAVDSY